ncbi:hypothetical protein [Leucobacter sp. OH1287]|uniref:phage tail tube protein n=1 Tax=Leucobacter sp. OH1287 TaxID=2491049 RepID=UPI000F5E2C24|nr:hypothetical protein [Leucobacter sp. OH1287]RRD61374.1 hypothetical protein EII30_02960 [Leucobacter sp. OH1287]
MAKVRDNVRIYGDSDSEIFLAPLGTQLPTTLTGMDPAFKSVGWLSEDGISASISVDTKKLKGFQGGATIRTKNTSTEKTLTFQMLEENPNVTALYYGHGAVVKSGSQHARADLPESIPVIERACVVKVVDGNVTRLDCYERVQITERGEVVYKNEDSTVYEVTAEILGASYFLTNAPAFLE